ncbi:YCF48-related protein [Calditrichota bacterium]
MKNLLLKSIPLIILFIIGFAQNNSSILSSHQNLEWNIISEVPGGMNEIYFIDSTNGWVIGDYGEIYVTEDGGISWVSQISRTENKLRSICFIDDSIGFASGYNRTLIYTKNKGNTWTPIPLVSDSGTIYNSFCADTDHNIYFITNYGEVYCSEDSGTSWYNKYNFNIWGFNHIDFSNYPICFAKRGMIGSFYKSTDGGNSWVNLYTPSPLGSEIYFMNGDIGWAAEDWTLSSIWHDSLSVHITLNGGQTWVRQSTLPGIFLHNIKFVDTFEGWATQATKIYYSPDSSQSWFCQFDTDSIGYIKDIFFLNERNGWTLTSQGKIIKYGVPIQVSIDKSVNNYTDEYIIYQNYPNPFNPSTKISYSISNSGFVTLKIYDLLGKEVQTLVNEFQNTGLYAVDFNASDLSSGIYIYKFQVGNDFFETKKMLFLR